MPHGCKSLRASGHGITGAGVPVGHFELHDRTLWGPDGWGEIVASLVVEGPDGDGTTLNIDTKTAEALHAALGAILGERPVGA